MFQPLIRKAMTAPFMRKPTEFKKLVEHRLARRKM